MYEQIKKNNVSSQNQLKKSNSVRFYNADGKGLRVMFMGNSITLHGRREEIGWYNEHGMAASEESKDYVHLLMSKISQKNQDAAYCICQVSAWESEYKEGKKLHENYENAKNFEADIIIARYIENCSHTDFEPETFKREYLALLDYINSTGKAKVVFTGSFWNHPGDSVVREIAGERNCPYVELGDLGERDDMKAIGLFEHSGVASHPGDKGMEAIADRIWEAICSL